MSREILFYFWAAEPDDKRSRIFMRSAFNQGVNVRLSRCGSLLDKPRSLLRTLDSIRTPALVVVTDGFDVLVCRQTADLATRYKRFGTEIVFGGEVAPVHHTRVAETHFAASRGAGPYRYLNSGMLMGTSDALAKMLRTILDENFLSDVAESFYQDGVSEFRGHFNDQTLFGAFAAANPELVSIDSNASMFWNLSRECQGIVRQIAFDRSGIVNRKTGTNPVFLHVPYLARYYCTYLWIASMLEIPLKSSNVLLGLWDSSLEEKMVPVDRNLKRSVENLWSYRARAVSLSLSKRWTRFRMAVGYYRRLPSRLFRTVFRG